MISSVRLHQAVLVAALVVPVALFTAAAWQNHQDVQREGRDAILRTSAIMQEQAEKVFETAELAIGRADDRTEDQTRAEIAAPATSEFLRRLKAPMNQLVSIWIADADGVIQAGSQPWPAGRGVAARDFFKVHQAAPQGTYVSPPFTGVATTLPSFAISIRRTTVEGGFDGTIHAAVSPAYFSRFFAEAAPPLRHVAVLFLDDGTELARDPPNAAPLVLGPDAPVMRRIALGMTGGVFSDVGDNGVRTEYALRRVGTYPAHVVFAVPRAVLMHEWFDNLQVYGAVAGAAALTLLGVSYLALRRAEAEQEALIRLETESRQRLAAEQQLRHAQRMDAVGQLTGGVAHDFNNLLTAILGNLELIERVVAAPAQAVPSEAQARIARLAGTAMKAVQRGAALTKSLLAFSRKQPLQPQALDANVLLADFLDLLRQAVGSGVTLAFEPAAALPDCIADPAELEAALLNLAINARDATRGKGRLYIRTAAATLDAAALANNPEAKPGAFVAVEVADDGCGMWPEVAAKAFEPFFTTKPVGQGTGLGLSQVYGFIRQLGGHVTLDSAPDRGTRITLFLPAAASV